MIQEYLGHSSPTTTSIYTHLTARAEDLILFRASSEALQKLAWDERFVGGRVGMVGVLHTWTRALIYHPHVHNIVTGGGLSEKGGWKIAEFRETASAEASARSSWSKNERERREKRSWGQQPPRKSPMSELRKRDEADRDAERERTGATLIITCEPSTKLRSVEDADFTWRGDRGVRLGEQQGPIDIHERDCVRRKMKPSKRPAHLGNGKLAEGVSSQREATETGRVAEYAAH